MTKGIKKCSLAILAFIALFCMALSLALITPSVANADVVQGTVPTFSTTKYQISSDDNNLLLVTGMKDLGDVYEVGYNFFDANGGDVNSTVTKVNAVTDKYFSAIKSGEKTWTVADLFGDGYVGMIVWEVAYDSAVDYTYQAYAKVGDRNDGQLVTSNTVTFGTKKLLSTTGASVAGGTYALVVPETSSSLIDFAAEEFNTLLKEVSGVELAIVKDNAELPASVRNYISLGKTSKLTAVSTSTDYSALGQDGFAVTNVDGNIYVDANTDRGVLWGVYEVLERYAGVRFLSQSYTYAPSKDIVKFDFEDFTCVPEFEQRDILAGHQNTSNYYYRITRYGEFGDTDWTSWANELGNIHTITDYYVLPSVWKASHPEFFSSYTNDKVEREDVCWSNGITDSGELDTSMDVSVASIVIDKIIEQLKLTPDKEFFMLGIADQWNAQCKCETCLERAVGKEGLWGSSIGAVAPTWGSYSGVTTAFCNAVVDAVNAWIAENGATYGIDHEVNVIEFAYYWTENAPVKKSGNTWVAYNDIVKPNDNVYVRIAPLNANFLYAYGDSANSKYNEIIEQWAAITDNLMLYDYAEKVNLFTTWLPTLTYIQEQAQYLKEKDFYYWMFEADYSNKGEGLWYMNLLTYVLQDLWWDVDADLDAVIDEFIELYHGEAASAYVKEFYNVMQGNIEAYINEGGNTMGVFGTDGIEVDAWSKATLDSAIAKLNTAINAVNADSSLSDSEKALYIKNINEALIIPKSIMLFNASTYGLENVDELKYEFKQLATSVGLTYVAYNDTTVDMFLDSIIANCDHTEELAWERTETKHKSYYPCCNAVVVALEDHEWSNGKCTECAYVCSHPEFDANDLCVICGSACTHNSTTGGYCDTCGECVSTDYTNGVCNNCGATCEHGSYVDGYCAQCAMPCAHNYADGTCSICGDVQVVYANGLTTSVENETLVYSINGGSQNITFDNVDGKKWLSFDFMMNSKQGYAYLQVGYNNYGMNIDIVKAVVKSTGEDVVFTHTEWSGENAMQNNVWYTVLVNTNGNDFYFKHWSGETSTTKVANVNFLDISTTSGSALSIDSINGETVYTLVKTAGLGCNQYGDNAFWFTTGDAETLTFDFYSADFNYFQLCAGNGTGYSPFDVYNKVVIINSSNGQKVEYTDPQVEGGIWTGEVLPTNTWLSITVDVKGIQDLGIIFWQSASGTAQIKNIAFDNAQHKHTAFTSLVINEETHKLVYACCGEVIVEEEHNFVNGICSVCGYSNVCIHNWNDGVCTKCGDICEHANYVDGCCEQCAIPCAHDFADGTCSICGYACEHDTIVDGNCTACDYTIIPESDVSLPAGYTGNVGYIDVTSISSSSSTGEWSYDIYLGGWKLQDLEKFELRMYFENATNPTINVTKDFASGRDAVNESVATLSGESNVTGKWITIDMSTATIFSAGYISAYGNEATLVVWGKSDVEGYVLFDSITLYHKDGSVITLDVGASHGEESGITHNNPTFADCQMQLLEVTDWSSMLEGTTGNVGYIEVTSIDGNANVGEWSYDIYLGGWKLQDLEKFELRMYFENATNPTINVTKDFASGRDAVNESVATLSGESNVTGKWITIDMSTATIFSAGYISAYGNEATLVVWGKSDVEGYVLFDSITLYHKDGSVITLDVGASHGEESGITHHNPTFADCQMQLLGN